MADLTFRNAQQEVDGYLASKGEKWTRISDPFFRVTFLAEEVGELARAVINYEATVEEPNRRGLAASRAEKLAIVKDSLGDVVYHLLGIATAYGLDLGEAFQDSMATIKKRYPVPST